MKKKIDIKSMILGTLLGIAIVISVAAALLLTPIGNTKSSQDKFCQAMAGATP